MEYRREDCSLIIVFHRASQITATMKQDQLSAKDADALQTVEDLNLDEQKHARLEQTDYAGAALKSSPEEIKLVRKLDFRIMVCSKTLPQAVADSSGSPCSVSCTS